LLIRLIEAVLMRPHRPGIPSIRSAVPPFAITLYHRGDAELDQRQLLS